MLNAVQGVVSKVESAVSHVHHHIEVEATNIFTMSDEKIIDLVYGTHVHAAEKSFDEDSLFVVVENVLMRSSQIIDKIVQGVHVHVDNIEEKHSKGNLSVPLCTLKAINNELSCKAPNEETAHKTTLAILNKLSNYTWEAKAVLALAAFAFEFGDFWLIAHHYHSDPLSKQLGLLKRVPGLIKTSELQKHRQTILELSSLIKLTMRVIAIFDEFEKLSISYDLKYIPGLSIALDHMPLYVYWAILTIAACATKLGILISSEPDRAYDLSPYSQKISFIFNQLTMQLNVCRRQLAEAEAYRRLCKLILTPTEIMEIFKALVFYKFDVVKPLIDGSTNRTVNIDVLRRKNVFMFFAGLDITEEDISILKPVYDLVSKKEKSYTIVWIPIVEQWTDELKKKYEILRTKMPWYSLQLFSPLAGIRFIKEHWQYKGKPMLVVTTPQGKVENLNALHLIRVWGLKAFPFDRKAEEIISKERHWIGSVVNNVHPTIETWVKEEKYIFFYGGKDNDFIQTFTKNVTALQSDPFIKGAKINIELFCVGKTAKGGEDHGILSRFWTGIESLFFTKDHKEVDPVTQEIQKLLSYKNESGWAVLSKGSAVVTTGHGSAILKVIEDFEQWKEVIKVKGFEVAFKEFHTKVTHTIRHCCRLDVPTLGGKAPDRMKCPECTRTMETYISYKCCHIDGPLSAHH
ncbi:protein SIEVE ELEMENT OCCLUSION B-like [Humulus lupulus]|uniref:protein SIEVE ELEMENT OCCLUSION B-like n=1 Tax=Humulus lupulus TaxID=3486 RepID=UPI002B413E90|nr:protein SIEVE ELEMENT OCCLUSION B-like [Humulus lupulus]